MTRISDTPAIAPTQKVSIVSRGVELAWVLTSGELVHEGEGLILGRHVDGGLLKFGLVAVVEIKVGLNVRLSSSPGCLRDVECRAMGGATRKQAASNEDSARDREIEIIIPPSA